MQSNYWSYFYKKYEAPCHPSDFAIFVNKMINKSSKIIDIGCGNGRDSHFFEENGHNVCSIDSVKSPNFLGKNLFQTDALELNVKGDVYYCRFFLHTLDEKECDLFLERMSNLMDDSKIFIETRASEIKNKERIKFKSPIGEEHYRTLYSIDYLEYKLSKYFTIEMISESDSFAAYGEERPLIIRAILKRK